VVGIDVEPSQIALAQTSAAERGIANARFETGNVSALPFPDATFDAAFGHTIVMQFRDPVPALTEVYRVLKPGGVVGFREVDFDGNLCEPPEAAWQEFWNSSPGCYSTTVAMRGWANAWAACSVGRGLAVSPCPPPMP
jgi:ubiquinone/menaquinone biosynthesis C-methylase UbiE